VWTLQLAAGGLCQGDDAPSGQWRSDSSGLSRPQDALETGQTLDHQPRPRLCSEKKQRDRLSRLATTHPDWALGFADEVWWSPPSPAGDAHLDPICNSPAAGRKSALSRRL
jgi:hypothetical protein